LTAPRLEIDLSKIEHNTRVLVEILGQRGISVCGVTKAMLGAPLFANTLLGAGVKGLADSRVENIQSMRHAGIDAHMSLIRSPMISQVEQVITASNMSLNTEIDVIAALSEAASSAHTVHSILLMVELGDLREGIMPNDLEDVMRKTLSLPNIKLEGIGTNLACRSGVVPDAKNMGELSQLANTLEATFGGTLSTVSGGNSANLNWALGDEGKGRINNLRLGEAILLGCEPLYRQPIDALFTDAFILVAEIIEAKQKPITPRGSIAQTAFGDAKALHESGTIPQLLLVIGQMDTDTAGLTPPDGMDILGASSDHLIVSAGKHVLSAGSEVEFQLNYSALMRAMISPFVTKKFSHGRLAHWRSAKRAALMGAH